MFKPNFKYSNKIVKLLTKISATREIIKSEGKGRALHYILK
jgi:hypothetical protein